MAGAAQQFPPSVDLRWVGAREPLQSFELRAMRGPVSWRAIYGLSMWESANGGKTWDRVKP